MEITTTASGVPQTVITNSAVASSDKSDPNPGNNSSSVTTTIAGSTSGGGGGSGSFTLNVTISKGQGDGSGTVTSTSTPDAIPQINCSTASELGCSAVYASGTVVTLTAVPNQDSTFVGTWSGDCSGDDPVCTITMTSDKTVNAHFSKKVVASTGCVSNCGTSSPSSFSGGGNGGGGGGGNSISPPIPQVAGAITFAPSITMPDSQISNQIPEVLGASTSLPRTGLPFASIALMVAAGLVVLNRKLKFV